MATNTRSVRANPAPTRPAAGEMVGADRRERTVTEPAISLSGKQMPCAPVLPKAGGAGVTYPVGFPNSTEAVLNRSPNELFYDAKMGHFLEQPFVGRIET